MYKYIVYNKNGDVIGYTNDISGEKILVSYHGKDSIVNKEDIKECKPLDFFALNRIMRERNGEL